VRGYNGRDEVLAPNARYSDCDCAATLGRILCDDGLGLRTCWADVVGCLWPTGSGILLGHRARRADVGTLQTIVACPIPRHRSGVGIPPRR